MYYDTPTMRCFLDKEPNNAVSFYDHSLFSWSNDFVIFYTPPYDSGGVLWFHIGHPSVRFSLPDDNLSKHLWIFTKLGMCIDIMQIWFGIANGQISSNFYGVICPRHDNGEVL